MHGDRSPAAAVALLRAAGIPARVVRTFAEARRHPLVLSWPATSLNARGRARVLAYVRHGGTFLAVAPSTAVRAGLGAARVAFFTRLVQVPERGLESGGHLRDSQIAALRRFWAATPGGFRLGDAPGGARSALVLLHDVRGLQALRAAGALVQRERATGVHATYVVQTRYLADARGRRLVGPALSRLVHAVRSASADVAAGGVAGGPLMRDAARRRQRDLPDLRRRVRIVDRGRRRDAERRAARLALRARSARRGRVEAFRGVAGETPRGFAAVAEETGIGVDATLSVDAAGGAFPFWQAQADGLERRLLRFPVAVDDVPGEGPAAALAAAYVGLRRNWESGAPTLVELTPDRHGCAGAVERALLADTPPDVWRGTLDGLAAFWEQRAGPRAGRPAARRRPRLARARAQRAPGERPIAGRALPRRARDGTRRTGRCGSAAATASSCPLSPRRRPWSSFPRT